MISSTTNLKGVDVPQRGMPVTLITGFLGSGKTTLLNYILQNRQDLKVAVLVNEFGDIKIDSQLLVSVEEDMVELSNGCICCTINEGLVEAVYNVLEHKDRIDYLVIETTGLADPLPIMLTFLRGDLRELTRLDSVLTVVDAEAFTPEHFDSDTALDQLIYGDVIILNKTDLVAETKVDELEHYIHSVKAEARILQAQQGEVPLPLILDVGLTNAADYADREASDSDHHSEHEHNHHHEHDSEDHANHLANDGFMSVSFQSDQPFIMESFGEFLNELPATVFRAKGILWFKESEQRHIFQLSGKRCDLKTDDWSSLPSNQLYLPFLCGEGCKLPEVYLQVVIQLDSHLYQPVEQSQRQRGCDRESPFPRLGMGHKRR
ncbi:CobW family GTP-binding protein [Coleofasciculus sp.]|uniref:CobW family GTP-binding protein n=1 Tax=Coleofasciculus sp. TaxID=3100458 RepID=UPI003A26C085